ncbi:TetR/AcrR family transcriptional regulator [Nocardia sp. alder85J]|uniref:TetR/AcrR family transcriptional regulator n=1 Tax=Nocardia sp. alder85J TaxID=2862949 RepID=UPI001CD55131|nr:TetR family transcriptional regulator [Nocardia sp. alder85J]MCX4097589.1 TetR family transcriptional regulator [Nocardia sp. alder85J]
MSADTPRARLLRRGEQLLAGRGRLSDLSLRKLAEHLGTSHRMLIHHFGSRDGFLAALLSELRRQEQRTLRALADRGDYDEALLLLERLYLDPAHRPRIAAFFYVLGLAVQDPATYGEFLDSLEDWITLVATLGERMGMAPEEARARAQALVWAARGLFVTAITRGDGAAAFEEFRTIVRHLGP